jgi:hypothetical protein
VFEDIVADHEVEVAVRKLVDQVGDVADEHLVQDSLRLPRHGLKQFDPPNLARPAVLKPTAEMPSPHPISSTVASSSGMNRSISSRVPW